MPPVGYEPDVYGPQNVTTDYVPVAKPVAGANATYSFSRDFAVKILAGHCTLVTDANAADRFITLDFLPGGDAAAVQNGAAVEISASDTRVIHWNKNLGFPDFDTNVVDMFFPLLAVWLPCPLLVQFTVAQKQATDQLSALGLVVQRLNA
jgi:hypothetical protein